MASYSYASFAGGGGQVVMGSTKTRIGRAGSTIDDFGPRLDGYFDFTLLFEQSVLSIIPSALLLLAVPWKIARLYAKPAIVKSGWLLRAKLIACALLFGLQAALLALWIANGGRTIASIPAAALGVAASASVTTLSYLEHRRSIEPSKLLAAYLWLATTLDFAQARSLFTQRHLLVDVELISALFVALQGVRLVLLILEEQSKRNLLPGKAEDWSIELTSGPLSRCTFWWLNGLFMRGYRTQLQVDDLGDIGDDFSSEKLLSQIQDRMDKGNPESKYLLLSASWSAFKWPFLKPVFPRILKTIFRFSQPLLINRIIRFVSEPRTVDSDGISRGLIAATAIVALGVSITEAVYEHVVNRFIVTLRGGLASLIFRKTIRLDTVGASDHGAITLMSTDIDGITSNVMDFHELWANIIDLCIAMYLLYNEIGAAFFLVGIPAILCTVLTGKVSDGIGPARMEWNGGVQIRVGDTSSMLSQIKSLKMMGLTDYMGKHLRQLRIHELELSKKFRNMIVWIIAIANTSHQLTPASVIIAAIFWTRSGPDGFSVAQAFTALSIINLIATPMAELTSIYPQLMGCLACFERIQKFLLTEERKDDRIMPKGANNGRSNGSTRTGNDGTNDSLVALRNVTVTMPDKAKPILQNVTLDIKPDTLTMVVGPVGCGKSSLLQTILGELKISDGVLFFNSAEKSVAFCDQTPWLRNVSVRENILTGSEYDHEWYQAVVRACALDEDIERLPDRDHTLVGSGGVTLSGGQKQRLALARAVYSRNSILLLDDIFSALDTTTSSTIFNNLLKQGGLLRRSKTTVVLTTHAAHYLPQADAIIVLGDEGKIQQSGSFSQLKDQVGYIKDLAIRQRGDKDDDASSDTQSSTVVEDKETPAPKSKDGDPTDRQVADWDLYKFYLSSVPKSYILLFVFLGSGYIIVEHMPAVWIKFWTEHGTQNDTAAYFSVYAALCAVTVIFSAASPWWFMNKLIPQSAIHLHQQLLDTYLRAPLWFVSSVDNGVILNRFSQDMTLVDQQMPMAFFETTLNVTVFIVTAVIIATGAPYVAVFMPTTIVLLYILQRFYMRTSQQMRHLDLESKSPLYAHFTETLNGVATIRAFGLQDNFLKDNLNLLDYSQKPYYYLFCIQQWLNLSMGLYSAGVSVLLVGLAMKFADTTSGGQIGLAMVNLMSYNGCLSFLVRSWTNMETSLGAAARVRSFVQNTPNENAPSEKMEPPQHWPSKGSVDVTDVTAAYRPGGESVLRNVSLNIKAGQKIGICGRTGSGKSSLILTLLRLLETTSGSMRIDGIDLTSTIRDHIRSQLTVLPQDPVKLPGSVRDNLDPDRIKHHDGDQATAATSIDDYNDDRLKTSLQKAGIWNKVEEGGGLDAKFEDLGLSHGQHQLFALARTFLRRGKLVLLDEATSSVDGKTDEELQQVLKDVFHGCTVVTVAHRLESIIDADTVVVMDSGEVAEVGNPQELKGKDGSLFRSLWESRHG